MGSQTLALFFRALRVDARQLPSHVMRLGLLGFVLITLLWAQATALVMGAPGLMFFMQISYINLAFATFAGPLLFATCITEEKEEQTLGLLRMANVGPLSLLLGKLAPRLASALLILIVQFPFTLLAITLGGVSWSQVFAAFCTLLAHVFLVANVGLFCSVIARRTNSAVGLCALFLFAYLVLPGVTFGVLSSGLPPGATGSSDDGTMFLGAAHKVGLVVSRELYHSTAFHQLWVTLTTGFDGGPLNQQVISNLAGGGLLFLLGWLVFDVFNRNIDVATASGARTLASLFQRKGRTAVRAWKAAIVGREFRFAAGGFTTWIIKLLIYGPVAYCAVAMTDQRILLDVDPTDFGAVLMFGALFVVLPIEATVLASRLFRGEIKEKTWSTLCMLPRSLAGVAYSKLAGTALALVPVVFYFLVGSQLYPRGVVDFAEELGDPQTIVATFLVFAHFVFFLHLVTWFSILTNSWTGILLALLTWFIGMWAWYFCLMIPMMLGMITGAMDPENYMLLVTIISGWALLALAALIHVHIGTRLRAAAAL